MEIHQNSEAALAKFSLKDFRSFNLPAQDVIMSSWKGNNSKPLVSIICLTFNQEQYIEDAIRGFLIQETDFPFEIIIHDDASTDSTTEILKTYADKYSKIIRLIIQTENQYTKSPNSIIEIPTRIARGDYIALCEGDDFWIHPNKLQLQVELLDETYTDICFTAGKYSNNGVLLSRKEAFENLTRVSLRDVIRGGGGFMLTASIMIRKHILEELPSWFFTAPVGDYYLQILGAARSGACFIPEETVVYRVASIGSWSSSGKHAPPEKLISNAERHEFCLECFHKNSENSNRKDIDYAIANQYATLAWLLIKNGYSKEAKSLIRHSWKKYNNSSRLQVVLWLFIFSPNTLRQLQSIKDQVFSMLARGRISTNSDPKKVPNREN